MGVWRGGCLFPASSEALGAEVGPYSVEIQYLSSPLCQPTCGTRLAGAFHQAQQRPKIKIPSVSPGSLAKFSSLQP